jgi:hypothetical protein
MGLLTLILAILAGLCGVMGILTATDVFVPDYVGLDNWMFWFGLSAILFIATIAARVGRSE